MEAPKKQLPVPQKKKSKGNTATTLCSVTSNVDAVSLFGSVVTAAQVLTITPKEDASLEDKKDTMEYNLQMVVALFVGACAIAYMCK